MSSEITMPKLSDTMTEGLFAGWKKRVGDRIERGDIIAEVETDKAVMELEAFSSGMLIKTMVNGGENVAVGTVLGLIGDADELADSAISQPSTEVSLPQPPEPATVTASAPAPPLPEPPPAVASNPEAGHEKASPLVRRLARQDGIDLEQVKGSGPEGRITQDDLVGYTQSRQASPAGEAPMATPPKMPQVEHSTQSPMRQAVADTVTESWRTIPHFSVTVEIDMNACHEIVQELKERPVAIGFNSLVIKASAAALKKYPLLRAETDLSSDGINISFAVSLPDGVLMPVISQCQRLTVTEIEQESTRLAEKSRTGRLTSAEMSGGSFSVSNLGMYGVDEFTALILPGQKAILAVGAVCERAVARNGQLVVASTMRVTISCDHRTVDGAYAASFLAELRSVLEKPVSLLI